MSTSDTIKQDLMGLVSGHDWSYMMSDDHREWDAGLRVERDIKAKVHALIAIHREDGDQLYKDVKGIAGADYSDYDSKGNGLKYRVINDWFKDYIDIS